MTPDFWSMTIGNILTFAGIAIGFMYTWFKASRDRTWTQEDSIKQSEALAAKVASDAAAIAEKAKTDALVLAIKTATEARELASKTQESIEIAFKEANSYNRKLEAFNGRLIELGEHLQKGIKKPVKKGKK